MDTLIELDQALFLFLNSHNNSLFDFIMYWLSDKLIWLPLYVFIIITLYRDFNIQSILVILTLILVIVVVDQVTSSFMKPFFERLRPCHDPRIADLVHNYGSCGGRFGFVSGHAANSFAVATFIFFVLRVRNWWWLFLWASVVAYSRIYLGVHYPGDILIGGIFGAGVAYFSFRLLNKFTYRIFNPL